MGKGNAIPQIIREAEPKDLNGDGDPDMCLCGMVSKNVLISAVSNLSTAYNIMIINITHVLIEEQYCGGSYCAGYVDIASTMGLVGCSIGQLSFGIIGDKLGRSKALQLTMALTIFGAILQSFAVPITDDPASIFTWIAISRVIMGVGVGGVYPLSATIAVESAGSGNRGATASIVFSMQGVAYLMCPCVAMFFIWACGTPVIMPLGGKPVGLGWSWRLTTAFGALPGILLIPFRATETLPSGTVNAPPAPTEIAPLTGTTIKPVDISLDPLDASLEAAFADPNHPAHKEKDPLDVAVEKAALDPNQPAHQTVEEEEELPKLTLCDVITMKEYWAKMLGTAGGWCLFDFTFYGNNLFQASVLSDVFPGKNQNPKITSVKGDINNNLCLQMALVALIALPGYYVAVCFMDRIGRRNIQLQGFFFMSTIFAALGIWYDQLKTMPFLILFLYGMTFFFSNFGPNSTTFIVAAETYPTEMRTTMHGFSASMGMMGAAVGSALFKPLSTCTSCTSMNPIGFMMIICAAVAAAGGILTWGFVEDRRSGMEESPTKKPSQGHYGALSKTPQKV